MANDKTCFVISPIGDAGSPERKRSDTLLKHIFKKALQPLGYTVIRADEISQPGSITLQVLEKVLESTLVVADLTDHNPNVFYELAVRHASERPVIHVISCDQKIPFDVADLRTIKIAIDLEGAEEARAEIEKQAKEIEKGHVGETPVKLAGILKHFASGKPGSEEKVILKQILDGLSELRLSLGSELSSLAAANTHFREMFEILSEKRVPRVARFDFNVLYPRLEQYLQSVGDRLKDTKALIGPEGSVQYTLLTEKGQEAHFFSKTNLAPDEVDAGLLAALKAKNARSKSS